MTDKYVPRSDPELDNLKPSSPRERNRVRKIKEILRKYMVRGTEKDLDAVAIEIWREIKR